LGWNQPEAKADDEAGCQHCATGKAGHLILLVRRSARGTIGADKMKRHAESFGPAGLPPS
jgi:hypothetical protein